MAAICRPMPRRGASSVVDSRSGAPEPEAVTGKPRTSVEVPPSIAEGPVGAPTVEPVHRQPPTWRLGLLLVLVALALYAVSNPVHHNTYNHFVWQADAFLHGRAWFPYPVYPGDPLPQNWYLQDVYPILAADGSFDGRALLPFPPLPAVVLAPFVALWGLATDQEALAFALGAAGVGLAWWMLGGLRVRKAVRALTVGVLATGTAWWWAVAVGSTWYLAHLVATDLALLAVGVALRHDPGAAGGGSSGGHAGAAVRPGGAGTPAVAAASRAWRDRLRAAAWPLDRWQVVAGFLLGLAVTARLPLILAAPFLVLVGGGGTPLRRLVSAGAGGMGPVAVLLAYTFLTTGSLIHPGYAYQYQIEVRGYPALGYHADWSVEDPRYIGRNLGILLGTYPAIAPDVLPNTLGILEDVPLCTQPDARRSLFDQDCPLAVPIDLGTSLPMSAPGLFLALLAFRSRGRSRLALGATLAVLMIATFNLAHFSQGWVQWGYRFSLDFLPFLLPLVALGAARTVDGRPRLLAFLLLVAGALVNLWGVTWGQILAW